MTDRGLLHPANMKELNNLSVEGNSTDQGLRYLEGLTSLRSVTVNSSTNLSQSAIDHLRNTLPAIETLRTGDDDMRGMGGGMGG